MGDKDIKPYDLWFASVAYEDDPSKADDRPVLVIDEKRGIYAALKLRELRQERAFGASIAYKSGGRQAYLTRQP